MEDFLYWLADSPAGYTCGLFFGGLLAGVFGLMAALARRGWLNMPGREG